MKSSEIIQRARSLADLPETEFITYRDEYNSLKEAYQNLYTVLTDNNDDYFVETVQLTVDPNTLTLNNIYELELPTNFYRLRLASWLSSTGKWEVMEKYNIQQSTLNLSVPTYRLKNNKLLIKMPNNFFTSNIQIDYYPAQKDLTFPERDITYVLSNTNPSVYDAINYYVENGNDYLFYTEGDGVLRCYSKTQDFDVAVYTFSGNIVQFSIYKGKIVVRVDDDTTYLGTFNGSTLDNVIVIGTYGGGICNAGNGIFFGNYFSGPTATQEAYNVLTETSLGSASTSGWEKVWYGNTYRYIDRTTSKINNTDFTAVKLFTSNKKLYFYTSNNELYRLDSDTEATLILEDAGNTFSNMTSGSLSDDYFPINNTWPVEVKSLIPDTDVTYPNNTIYSILSTMIAIDFKIKQASDSTGLEKKLALAMDNLRSSLRRDDFNVARINNAYPTSNSGIWGGF